MESEYESDSYEREFSTSRRSDKPQHPVKNLPVEALEKDIVGLVLQYLDNAGYKEAAHSLEKEAKYYFDLKYFQQLFIDGGWNELLDYLKGFVTKEENTRFYFEILRHKFFDALDKGDKPLASKILKEEFWSFYELDENNYDPSSSGAQSFNEWASLLHFDDFKKHPTIRWTKSAKEMRVDAYPVLEKYLKEKVPKISAKLTKPQIPDPKRLRTLLNQAISFQVTCCVSQNKPTVINTLFVDHKCNEPQPPYGNYCFDSSPVKKFAVPSTPTSTPTSNTNHSSNNNGNGSTAFKQRGPASPVGLTAMAPSSSSGVKRARESTSNQSVNEYETPAKKRKTKTIFPENLIRADITWPNNAIPDVISFHPKFSGVLLGYSKENGLSFVNLYRNKQILIDNNIVDSDRTAYNGKSIIWSSDGRFFAVIPANYNEIAVYEFRSSVGDNFDDNENIDQAKFTIQKYNSIRIDAKIQSAVMAMLPFHERTKCYLIVSVEDSIRGYDIDNQDLVWQFQGHNKSATQLCLMNYEHLPVLLSVSDEFLYVWMFPVYEPVTVPVIVNKFACFKAPFVCQSIAFAGGRLFACSQGEGTVVELDYVQGTIMRRFHGLQTTQSTQLNVNSRFIISNGAYSVKFWSTESTASSSVDAGRKVDSVALSSDGKYLAIVSVDPSKQKYVNIYAKD